MEKLCPCSSGKSYEKCCKSYHLGKAAENALVLMRARFAAYALDLPDYIIQTTHPASPDFSENTFSWRRALSKFSKNSSFQNLEILDFKERGDTAFVTFVAHLSQRGQDATFTETSCFDKKGDRWFYRVGRLMEGHAPNLITTESFRVLPLAYYGEPILRKKAEPVAELTEEIKKLIYAMIETMDFTDSLGLAAPQVHHSLRIFVFRKPMIFKENGRERVEFGGELKVIINPEISLPSREKWSTEEACLSLPGIRSPVVERPREVTFSYIDLEGKRVEERVKGWEARIMQHEFDHLEGVLSIDYLSKQERALLEPALQRLQKRIHEEPPL